MEFKRVIAIVRTEALPVERFLHLRTGTETLPPSG